MSCARDCLSIVVSLFAIDDGLDSLSRLDHGVGLYHILQLEPVSEEAFPGQVIAGDHGQGLVVMLEVGGKTSKDGNLVVMDEIAVDGQNGSSLGTPAKNETRAFFRTSFRASACAAFTEQAVIAISNFSPPPAARILSTASPPEVFTGKPSPNSCT